MTETIQFVPMALDTAPGTKVKYLGINGYDSDRAHGDKYLTAGHEYTVERMNVHGWESSVALTQFPGRYFNTVMFETVDRGGERT